MLNKLESQISLARQDGVVYRTPCKCSKVYICNRGRSIQDRMKEHEHVPKPAPFPRTLTRPATTRFGTSLSLLIETHTRRVKEAIYITLHPNKINHRRRPTGQSVGSGTGRKNHGQIRENLESNTSGNYLTEQ